ncbi:hypothetical protein NCG89_07130 [Spongiibacter taiwanensis]|uniref:DUF6587 family protein n=1 Tax=Spongiibacter taiwanensis TaxID=1748242 RepID=UPI002034EE2B|nr:DUF6587 family protein [Spongiibacter taiwanensis]USA44541.1 hypothetical protein NCG89_07130 [Spongiibacter taiwanensis]
MTSLGHNLILAAVILTSVAIFIRHFFGDWSGAQVQRVADILIRRGGWMAAVGIRLNRQSGGQADCSSGCNSCSGCASERTTKPSQLIAVERQQ